MVETLVGTKVAVVRVNLLPPEIAEGQRLRRAQGGAALAAAAAVAIVGVMYVNEVRAVSQAKADLATEQAEGARLQSQLQALSSVEATYARLEAAEGHLTSAMGPEVRFSTFLNDLSLIMPDRVWITSLNVNIDGVPVGTTLDPAALAAAPTKIGSFTVNGVGFHYDDVAVWLETLARQKQFNDPFVPSLSKTEIGGQKAVVWSSTTDITSNALSRRFFPKAGQ